MFITSFEEQNITYRSCSNLRIHLCQTLKSYLLMANQFRVKLVCRHLPSTLVIIWKRSVVSVLVSTRLSST
ncbi:TPA: hypothetical protein JIT99_20130 [Acinetobacter baumannii]|nr:hypothetical protein [Acinetobacter baumannii]HAV4923203.1 hypothetical protein [Acinetobacter baumannii]